MEPVKILIIDDNFTEDEPLVVILKEKYGNENVVLKTSSSEGLQYIMDHLTSKLIVLLDLHFVNDEPSGIDVFKAIREETSLVYVIVMTANPTSSISQNDFIEMVNNNAMAFIESSEDIDKKIALVDKAAHQLDTRVDSVLEQWISKRPNNERKRPYLTTRSGETYSLNDLIIEIRKETNLGKKIEKGIIQLAIDLLSKGNEKLDD